MEITLNRDEAKNLYHQLCRFLVDDVNEKITLTVNTTLIEETPSSRDEPDTTHVGTDFIKPDDIPYGELQELVDRVYKKFTCSAVKSINVTEMLDRYARMYKNSHSDLVELCDLIIPHIMLRDKRIRRIQPHIVQPYWDKERAVITLDFEYNG